MLSGPDPEPVAALAGTVFDDVTYGYVPWSTSKSIPWAPSNNIFFLSFLSWSNFNHTGFANFKISGAIFSNLFLIHLALIH